MPAPKRPQRGRRKPKKNIPIGQAHIKTSFNNTIVSLTDREGNVIAWESAGGAGFKGSRKSTPFAAQVTADAAARKGMEQGLQKVEVYVKGPGSGRETAIRSLEAAGPSLLRRAGEAVPPLLREGEPPVRHHGPEPAVDAREPVRQRPGAPRLRRVPPAGAPAGPPWPLDGQRPPRRHPVLPGAARRRDRRQGRDPGRAGHSRRHRAHRPGAGVAPGRPRLADREGAAQAGPQGD